MRGEILWQEKLETVLNDRHYPGRTSSYILWQCSSAQSLQISTYSGGKHSLPNRVKLSIRYDEETYTFYLPRTTEAVEKALFIKGFFSSEDIQISTGGLKSVLRRSEWTPDAIQLLYELFEYTP